MGARLADKLDEMDRRFAELEKQLGDPEVIASQRRYAEILREHGRLAKMVGQWRALKDVRRQLAEARSIVNDPRGDADLKPLAEVEIPDLERRERDMAEAIKRAFLADDADAGRNAILEIRAGTGGEEAALFVADLLRMYIRYAESQGWTVTILDKSETDLNGLREVTASVEGEGAYRRLRYESGGHRVQRVPVTEAAGRIHTSLCTVACLPEAGEVDVNIAPEDIRIDLYCAGGAGGQKVNKTSSAVRMTHLPTGIVAQCQESPSQHRNRAQCMRLLATRIHDHFATQQRNARDAERRGMIGSGDRSERIRTYNFPQNRVTDHRINFSLYDLENVMLGRLDPVVNALIEHEMAAREEELSLD
ncbi:MAG TPA: peptide chain release factor 1 [Candidatus Brocadiia bacterium]|nr:peptide chain release factor 1 [Candidatus Brocadiia bacterium]